MGAASGSRCEDEKALPIPIIGILLWDAGARKQMGGRAGSGPRSLGLNTCVLSSDPWPTDATDFPCLTHAQPSTPEYFQHLPKGCSAGPSSWLESLSTHGAPKCTLSLCPAFVRNSFRFCGPEHRDRMKSRLHSLSCHSCLHYQLPTVSFQLRNLGTASLGHRGRLSPRRLQMLLGTHDPRR